MGNPDSEALRYPRRTLGAALGLAVLIGVGSVAVSGVPAPAASLGWYHAPAKAAPVAVAPAPKTVSSAPWRRSLVAVRERARTAGLRADRVVAEFDATRSRMATARPNVSSLAGAVGALGPVFDNLDDFLGLDGLFSGR